MAKDIKLRDLRIKEKFQIDDEYLNGYARLCGWKATLVYNSLCRHADKDQYSFPSVELMAEQHNVNRKTIMEGIKALQDWNIIQVVKERSKGGTWRNNGYTLLDKSEWVPKPIEENSHSKPSKPSPSHGHGKPGPSHGPDRVRHTDIKDTHKKETHNNDNKNGAFFESSRLVYFLRTDVKDERVRYIHQIINYYFFWYKKKNHTEHPFLKSEQLVRVKDTLGYFDEEFNMEGEEWGTMIDHWFTSNIETDYNINHFASEEILRLRYYEVIY